MVEARQPYAGDVRCWAFVAMCFGCSSAPRRSATVFVDQACAPDGIAADDTAVYWSALCPSGGINRTSIADRTTTVLVPNERQAYALKADSDAVYWETISSLDPHAIDGAIATIPKAGGSPTVIASAIPHPRGDADSFLIDEANVYWSSIGDSTLMSVPKSGASPPSVLAQASASPLIAEDTAYVFWSDGPSVHRVEKQTRESTTVYQPTHGVHAIAAHGSAVFVWSGMPADETVFSLYASDDDLATSPTLLFNGRPDVAVPPTLVDESHLYWLEGSFIMRSDFDGNDEQWVELPASDHDVTNFAANSTTLFWTNNSGSRIYAAPK